MDNLIEIIEACQEMRTLQKKYFKERTQSALVKSKEAERKVDRLLDKYDDDRNKQADALKQYAFPFKVGTEC